MTRPGSAHVANCSCASCTSNGVIQVVIPNTQVVTPGSGGGVQGIQGTQGRTGIQGYRGFQGAQGIQGTQGIQGYQGTQGIQGSAGYIGSDGAQGIQGYVGAQGIQGLQGTQGIQGLQGTDGGGVTLQQLADAIAGAALTSTDDLTEGTTNRYFTLSRVAYTHNQNAVSSSWVITHNLGFYPNIVVQDSSGTTYEGEVSYTNSNSLTVSFSSAFSGKAYLS